MHNFKPYDMPGKKGFADVVFVGFIGTLFVGSIALIGILSVLVYS